LNDIADVLFRARHNCNASNSEVEVLEISLEKLTIEYKRY